MKKNVSLGIDLGTTNTLITVKVEAQNPITLVTETGSRLIPSVVYFGKEEILVGENAEIKLNTDPLNTYFSTKRFLGRNYSALSNEVIEKYPYIINSKNKETITFKNTKQEKDILPQEVSAQILLEVMKIYTNFYPYEKYKLCSTVITVPAYFNHNQRKATIDAAAIAGIENVNLVHEPTAAAIAYTNLQEEENNTVVFDLGGGTFDISLVNYDGDDFWSVIASEGDDMIGGDDFDNVIISIIEKKCKKLEPNIKFQKNAKYLLKKYAKEFKEKLSFEKNYEINFSIIGKVDDLPFAPSIKISRLEFERASKYLMDKIDKKIRNFLSIDKVKNRQINNVVLVGGSSRLPKFKTIVEKLTKLTISTNGNFNSDEAVSLGAALYSEFINQGKVKISEVTPLNLGYEIKGDLLDVVVPMNSKIPLKKTNRYTTVEDFQDFVNMGIRQGNRLIASKNTLLGEFVLDGLSHKPKGEVSIEASIMIDQNGILTGEATDLDTKSTQKIIIKEYLTLTQDQIKELKAKAAQFLEKDKIYVLKIQLKEKIQKKYEDSKKYIKSLKIDNQSELLQNLEDVYSLSMDKDREIDELEKTISKIEYIYTNKSIDSESEILEKDKLIEDPFE